MEVSEHRIPVFKGISGEECANFLRILKLNALGEGKLADRPWMASFAACHFWGKALRWYLQLDPAVQGDWNKLQIAMTEEYKSEYEDAYATIPSLPAPLNEFPSEQTANRVGRIRVLRSNPEMGTDWYVSAEPNARTGAFVASYGTRNVMLVAYSPNTRPCALQILNPAMSGKWLGMKWPHEQPFDPLDDAYTAISANDTASSHTVAIGDEWGRSRIWDVALAGALRPVWIEHGCCHQLLVAMDLSTRNLFLYTYDGIGCAERVALVIEPVY